MSKSGHALLTGHSVRGYSLYTINPCSLILRTPAFNRISVDKD